MRVLLVFLFFAFMSFQFGLSHRSEYFNEGIGGCIFNSSQVKITRQGTFVCCLGVPREAYPMLAQLYVVSPDIGLMYNISVQYGWSYNKCPPPSYWTIGHRVSPGHAFINYTKEFTLTPKEPFSSVGARFNCINAEKCDLVQEHIYFLRKHRN